MIEAGKYQVLKVARFVEFGAYLTDGENDVLLPLRFMPKGLQEGEEIEVFVYHDSEDRIISTTQKPTGVVGEIVLLPVVSTTPQGAFMDWGLMKDLFVPKSQQVARMVNGNSYLVLIYRDEQTGRVAGTEKFQHYLSNANLTVKELEPVEMTIWQKTDIGFKVIINHKHVGVLHFNEAFKEYEYGERFTGFVKRITPEGKIDVVAGKPGYTRVVDEKERLLTLLREHDGYLPYTDKSSPEDIYEMFGMSKKTFKMTIGGLYKDRLITIEKAGIRLVE
jgi:predicted RNA-binding protein (virulence factor B family)